MALQLIDLTTPQPGGKFGDPTKTAWEKVNDNSDYLEDRLQQLAIGAGDGSEALSAIQELQTSIDDFAEAAVYKANLEAATGAALVGYIADRIDAVPTTTLAQIRGFGLFPENFDTQAGTGGDDTAALQKACSVVGAVVWLQAGKTYRVKDVKLENGVAIKGFAGYGYTGDEAHKRPRVLALSGARSIFNVADVRGASVEGIALDGDLTGAHGFTSGSSRLDLSKVTIIRCQVALGGRLDSDSVYTRSAHVTNCVFATNTVGIKDPVDSYFCNGEVANNGTNVSAQAGSNSNSFCNYRLEWATVNNNLRLLGASGQLVGSWQFSNCLFDRGNFASAVFKWCSGLYFDNCVFRRANSSGSAVVENNAGVYMENSQYVTLSNCGVTQGAGDSGEGATSPGYAYSFGPGCSNVSICGGNIFNALTLRGADTVTDLKVSGVNGADDRYNTTSGIQIKNGNVLRSDSFNSLAGSATAAAQLFTRRVQNTYTVNSYTLEVVVRNGSNSQGYTANFIIQLTRGLGAPTATIGVLGEVGTAGAISASGTGTTLDISVSAAAETGTDFNLSLANKTSATLAVTCTLK